MKVRDSLSYLRDTVFRLLPHRAPTGLKRIGNPGLDAPVLLTGNFTLTVRRMRQILDGTNAWLLVANSRGINVWCAAGGGHLTHHDVISVLRTSGISDLVDHRDLIMPQLAATGIERRPILEATGWNAHWGPARLEDVPSVLAHGGSVRGRERRMTFPLWERLEMASIWWIPTALVLALVGLLIEGWSLALAAALPAAVAVTGVFCALPRVPVTGHARWLTYGLSAALSTALGAGVLELLQAWTPFGQAVVIVASVLAMLVLSIDLTGTTPLYPSSVNSRKGTPAISLDGERCTGAADCIQVCPSNVLVMMPFPVKVSIANPEDCIACAACIVQCPEDALFFSYADGRIVEPSTIRRTRLNLVGERTIEVRSRNRG
jgi:ferredoxin